MPGHRLWRLGPDVGGATPRAGHDSVVDLLIVQVVPALVRCRWEHGRVGTRGPTPEEGVTLDLDRFDVWNDVHADA